MAIISHYNDDDTASPKKVSVDFGKNGKYEIYLLDQSHDATLIETTDILEFELKNFNAVLIKEV